MKQEAHGPHRSPEKTVQINKHIWLYHNVDKEKKKKIINFMRIYWFFIWRNLNPLHPKMLCAKIDWNWPCGSGKGFFKNFINVFLLFCIYLPLEKRMEPFIWRILNPLHPRMHCAKFGWNWPSGSGEDF